MKAKDVVFTDDYLSALRNVKWLEALNGVDLLRRKILGLQGEMVFHVARGQPYETAFKVAESYFIHGLNIEWEDYPLTVPEDLLYVYPDACLNPAEDVDSFCGGSLKVNVKTSVRQAVTAEEGLLTGASKDELYVAVSQRSRGDKVYEKPTYAVLGYALREEVYNAVKKRGLYFIQRLNLHPFYNFNVKDYLNPVKIKDLT